jgi:hypothetical protein
MLFAVNAMGDTEEQAVGNCLGFVQQMSAAGLGLKN